MQDLFEFHFGIEALQYELRDFDPGDRALLLAQQAHASVFVGRDARERRVVAVADVLPDAEFDQFIYERFVFGFHGSWIFIL